MLMFFKPPVFGLGCFINIFSSSHQPLSCLCNYRLQLLILLRFLLQDPTAILHFFSLFFQLELCLCVQDESLTVLQDFLIKKK